MLFKQHFEAYQGFAKDLRNQFFLFIENSPLFAVNEIGQGLCHAANTSTGNFETWISKSFHLYS